MGSPGKNILGSLAFMKYPSGGLNKILLEKWLQCGGYIYHRLPYHSNSFFQRGTLKPSFFTRPTHTVLNPNIWVPIQCGCTDMHIQFPIQNFTLCVRVRYAWDVWIQKKPLYACVRDRASTNISSATRKRMTFVNTTAIAYYQNHEAPADFLSVYNLVCSPMRSMSL